MKTTVVLSLSKEKGVFKPYCLRQEYENISLAEIKERNRALRKFASRLTDEKVVIRSGEENSKIYSGKINVYNDVMVETVLPVLKALLVKCCEKFSLSLPLEEICIVAPQQVACKIMVPLNQMARMFSVVNENDYITKKYDEVYFKYGIPIRQMPDFKNNLPENSIIINCGGKSILKGIRRPVINITRSVMCSNLCVNALNVHITDNNIKSMEKCWGGLGSLPLYQLLSTFPSENACVNINEEANEIFLLDTALI